MILGVSLLINMNVMAFAATSDESSDWIVGNEEAWFLKLRKAYSGYGLNYFLNRILELKGTGYIYDQTKCPDFFIGENHMSEVGCEIAAIHNALITLGQNVPCSSIIRDIEQNGYIMSSGTTAGFGTDPYAIGEYFDDIDVEYCRYEEYYSMSIDVELRRGTAGVYIVSFWNNSNNITEGLHTVALYTTDDDDGIYVFNLYYGFEEALRVNFDSISDYDNFIVGYRLIPAYREN